MLDVPHAARCAVGDSRPSCSSWTSRKTVVTCEIKLFRNNFKIISVFYFTCVGSSGVMLVILLVTVGLMSSLVMAVRLIAFTPG